VVYNKKQTPVGRMEILNRDKKTYTDVYVDKNGSHIDNPPSWINENRKRQSNSGRSMVMTVPELPYLKKEQKDG